MTDTKDPQTINYLGVTIGVGILGILAFIAFSLVYVQIPETNASNFGIFLGLVSTQFGVLVGYLFGSSAASKKQADNTSKALDLATAATPVTKPDITLPPGGAATVAASPESP